MRAGFTNQKEFEMVFPRAIERRFEREAERRGITVPELIEMSIKAALDAGIEPPPKEGRVLPFKALKSQG